MFGFAYKYAPKVNVRVGSLGAIGMASAHAHEYGVAVGEPVFGVFAVVHAHQKVLEGGFYFVLGIHSKLKYRLGRVLFICKG